MRSFLSASVGSDRHAIFSVNINKAFTMRRTFAPIRLVALALPMLSMALALPTTATAQSSVAVKTALFKDIASYPEQNVPAQVVAANQVLIAAQISGVVQTWRVDAGARVNRGTTLAQLDPRDMSLVLAQAQAAQKAAQARLDLAKQQLARAKELVKQGFYSSEALNQRETEVALLDADLSARTAAVASAKHTLTKTNITAPFNAVVVQRMAQVGNTVAPGTPLFELVDTAPPEITTDLSVAQANSLKRATDIRWATPGQTATQSVALLRVIATVDSRTRNQTARLKFTRYGKTAPLPGANGSLRWKDSQPHLSPSALVRRGAHMGFFTIADGRAVFNPLPNAQESRPAPIDLAPETAIIIQGQAQLQDGQAVTAL